MWYFLVGRLDLLGREYYVDFVGLVQDALREIPD